MHPFERALRVTAIAAVALLAIGARAETLEVLHTFVGDADGSVPEGGVAKGPGDTIYGTAVGGGANNGGTLFRVADGQFQVLHAFGGGSDGSAPQGTLLLTHDGDLVGTTYYGGAALGGTVFRYRADGRYETLTSFPAAAGKPSAGVAEGTDGAFYGATQFSSTACACGTLFRLDPLTAQMTTLHAFDNKDGAYPESTPVFSGGRLFGTTVYGGIRKTSFRGPGVVYSMAPDGSAFAAHKASVGSELYAGLTADRTGRLWGVAYNKGPGGAGGVYRLNDAGETEWVHSFTRSRTSKAGYPLGTLLLAADGMLYGTTEAGGVGPAYRGTVFRIDPATGAFAVVHSFTSADGANPRGTLVQDAQGRILGTTQRGGALDLGVVYRLTP